MSALLSFDPGVSPPYSGRIVSAILEYYNLGDHDVAQSAATVTTAKIDEAVGELVVACEGLRQQSPQPDPHALPDRVLAYLVHRLRGLYRSWPPESVLPNLAGYIHGAGCIATVPNVNALDQALREANGGAA